MSKKVSELCVHVPNLLSAEKMAQFTSSDFAAGGSYSGLAGGHSLPLHGYPLFLDQVFCTHGNKSTQCPSDSRNWQNMSASSTSLGCSFRVLASQSETQNRFSSQSCPHPLHSLKCLPCYSLGNLPVHGCTFPCTAGI